MKTTGYVSVDDGTRLYYECIGSKGSTFIIPNGTYFCDQLATLARHRRIIAFDPRNRGRSDTVTARNRLGIMRDVEDVHLVVQQLADGPVDVIGHSFAGVLVALYARTNPSEVRRLVQLGPMWADPDRQFPPALTNHDETYARVMTELTAVLRGRERYNEVELCERVWGVLRRLYVFNAAHADRIRWGRCELPNERNGMRYFNEVTLASIRDLALTAADFRAVTMPALIVHGRKDRSAPYGSGREWAMALPNARLLSLPDVAHAPWIEAPDRVVPAIERFLDGEWPDGATPITSLEE